MHLNRSRANNVLCRNELDDHAAQLSVNIFLMDTVCNHGRLRDSNLQIVGLAGDVSTPNAT